MKKYSLFLLSLSIAALQLNAQDTKAEQQSAENIKNNSVPGWRYAPAAAPTAAPAARPGNTSLITEEIAQGKYGPVKAGGSAAASSAATQARSGNATNLPSSKSSSASTPQPAANKAAVQAVPSQGDVPAPAETKPSVQVRPAPVKKLQQ
jgi:hypothetical protein